MDQGLSSAIPAIGIGMFGMFGIIFFGAVVLIVLVAVYGQKAQKQRAAALAEFAQRHGLRRLAPGAFHPEMQYPGFMPFRRGFARLSEMTMVGTVELGGRRCSVVTGDFRYRERRGSGKNRRTVTERFSYLIVALPHPHVPDLNIRREGLFDKVAGIFSDADIDFESDEFSRRYHVSSKDRKFAYDLIDRPMMDFLMAELEDRAAGGTGAVEIQHAAMLMWTPGRWRAPEEFGARLGWADRFLARWPEHLVRRLDEGEHERGVESGTRAGGDPPGLDRLYG